LKSGMLSDGCSPVCPNGNGIGGASKVLPSVTMSGLPVREAIVLLAEDEASERPTVITGNLELRSLAMVSERTTTRGARDGVRNNAGIADGSVLQRLLED
jgi:hypothetical protein